MIRKTWRWAVEVAVALSAGLIIALVIISLVAFFLTIWEYQIDFMGITQ